MLNVIDKTPFETAISPGTDKNGADFATVIVKGCFELGFDGAPLKVAEEQVPLLFADEFWDEPDTSSMKYESDMGAAKNGTDVVLVGHAYPGRKGDTGADVSLSAGPLRKTVRVFGDRRWQRRMGRYRASEPEPFKRMPLVYERAFGGSDTSDEKPEKHAVEWRNPVGTGFTTAGRGDHIDDMLLANLEDPDQLVNSPKSKAQPAGFGFIARSWEPRKSHAGTYDAAWQQDRCPLLPHDFDELYYRSAHPDLRAPSHFAGGEPVRVTNVSRRGEVRFRVPHIEFDVLARLKMQEESYPAALDTVLIEPDEERVVLTWKATIPCPRLLLYLSWVRVRLADA